MSDPYAKLKQHFATVNGVAVNAGRGAQGIKAGKKMIVMYYKGDLLLTLPPARVEALIAAGRGLSFDPGTGKILKNRLLVPASKKRSWLKLCSEAVDAAQDIATKKKATANAKKPVRAATKKGKPNKATANEKRARRNPEVDAWFEVYDNPMKAVVQAIRSAMIAADKRIEECIKWQAPTFTYRGNLASFYPKSKKHASLMFHVGAKIPGDHPRLEGTGDTSRVMKLGSVKDVKAARSDIKRLVKAWCDWREAEQKPKVTKKAAAKREAKKATKATSQSHAAKKPSKTSPKVSTRRS